MRNYKITGDDGSKLVVMADCRENALKWNDIVRTEQFVRSLVYRLAHVYN